MLEFSVFNGQLRRQWETKWDEIDQVIELVHNDKSAHKFLQSCVIFDEWSTLRLSTQVDFEINLHKGLSKRGLGFNYFIKLVPLHWRFIAFCVVGVSTVSRVEDTPSAV